MLVEFGRASLLEKARQQPEKVRMVLEKVRTDGLLATMDAVRSKLAQPIQLGYCNAGVVMESGVDGISAGDRVVSNGPHAEVVLAPKNLCARIPDGVDDESAAFTVVASIGLQGVRILEPTIGECVVVTGCGLIGLLTVQLLRAQGCRVLAIDFDASKLALAASFGAETCNPGTGQDPVEAGMTISRGRGVDGVIITASTTSSDPVSQAARMSRKRGRIVLVGVTGLELNRADFYQKELRFQVSCSYGPGRYDPTYEEKGHDYPFGHVRWTEQRNLEAVLDLMQSGHLELTPLITHRFDLEQYDRAYEVVAGDEPSIGILLRYPSLGGQSEPSSQTTRVRRASIGATVPGQPRSGVVGLIGSGNYAQAMLIPALEAAGADLHTVACHGGLSGVHAARRFGFRQTTTDSSSVFRDPEIDTIVIATRHNSHAGLAIEALNARKNVFVEKPLALTIEELEEIRRAHSAARDAGHRLLLMVGFNRRFSPQIRRLKSLLESVKTPKAFVMTVNAGAIPEDHWTQDPHIGGGRILGEACHFIDLLRHLSSSPILRWQVGRMQARPADTVTISLSFEDGSLGSIHYLANGSKAFPKERLEVFAGGRVIQVDNFRRMTGYGWPGFSRMNLWRQDKGHRACAAAFLDAVRSGSDSPIPIDEIFEVSEVTVAIASAVEG